MRLLVVGANGLLGSNVVEAALGRDWDVHGTYHTTEPGFDIPLGQLDITDDAEVDATIAGVNPDVVVNCAAMTDVDRCEAEPDRAHRVNAEAPAAIGRACAATDGRLGHVSTDYVFDGRRAEPYGEEAEPNPIQVYGRSKLRGERAVREVAPEALVVRLSFVWGIHRGTDELEGFPGWVRSRLRAGEPVPLFTDQQVTPTRAGQAAATLLDLLEMGASGRVNVAARNCVTPYEFGEVLTREFDEGEELLREGSMADVERAASRPTSTCLDVERVESLRGVPQPTLQEDVTAVLPRNRTDG